MAKYLMAAAAIAAIVAFRFLGNPDPIDLLASSVKIEVPVTPSPTPANDGGHLLYRQVTSGWGSGTAVGRTTYALDGTSTHTLILTAEHVIDEARERIVVHWHGQTYDATMVAKDAEADLALLEVNADIPLATMGDASLGEHEWVVGYPFATGISVTEGTTSTIVESDEMKGLLQGSASAYPGNSGGGVFVYDHGFKLIGVMKAVRGYATSQFMPSVGYASTVSFAVPTSTVREFLKKNGL